MGVGTGSGACNPMSRKVCLFQSFTGGAPCFGTWSRLMANVFFVSAAIGRRPSSALSGLRHAPCLPLVRRCCKLFWRSRRQIMPRSQQKWRRATSLWRVPGTASADRGLREVSRWHFDTLAHHVSIANKHRFDRDCVPQIAIVSRIFVGWKRLSGDTSASTLSRLHAKLGLSPESCLLHVFFSRVPAAGYPMHRRCQRCWHARPEWRRVTLRCF